MFLLPSFYKVPYTTCHFREIPSHPVFLIVLLCCPVEGDDQPVEARGEDLFIALRVQKMTVGGGGDIQFPSLGISDHIEQTVCQERFPLEIKDQMHQAPGLVQDPAVKVKRYFSSGTRKGMVAHRAFGTGEVAAGHRLHGERMRQAPHDRLSQKQGDIISGSCQDKVPAFPERKGAEKM